jgi:alanine racemase
VGRNTIATINLSSIHANLDLLIDIADGSKIIAVVKANAYGNGAVAVAQSIAKKVDVFAVAFLSEAQELHQAGINKPILILQGPHLEAEFYEGADLNLIWMLHSEWQLDAYLKYSQEKPLSSSNSSIWLKFDTGMHRLGLPIDSIQSLLTKYAAIIDETTALATHLANADEALQSNALAQIDTFLAAAEQANLPLCLANSAANIRFKQARRDYVRLGIAMYGSTPFGAIDNPISLQSVMTLEAQIIGLRTIAKGDTVGYGSIWRAARESRIATVAIGYADGYPRHAPTSTPAWCKGKLIPLVGRVSMDMLTFDVSDLKQVEIGDVVQLWGNELPINDVAEHVGTIGYELMTRVSQRVPRHYLA